MATPIVLDQYTVPDKGTFDLHINRSVEIQTTAEEARRKVKRWLIDEISYMMTAELPAFVFGEQVVWRVPAIFTASHIGHVGAAGEVDVDVETGEMYITPEIKAAILKGVDHLAANMAPYKPAEAISDEWLAKDREFTHEPGRPEGNPLTLLPAD
ncbi:hypothetical protein KFU94_38140 [Chloroflexi bacterium TSY]|nr:hypothetical protein [Chloroflexi bacterium TSY]